MSQTSTGPVQPLQNSAKPFVKPKSIGGRILDFLWGLLDSNRINTQVVEDPKQETHLRHWLPYLILHAGCLGVIWVGWSVTAVAIAAALYVVRMFAITAFYHRYFSHRSYRTSRAAQFVFAVWGNSAVQRGPIWWAANHRHHHAHSDSEKDPHSPIAHSFVWSHIGWLTAEDNLAINPKFVPDWLKYPELRFLDRFDTFVPIILATGLFILGAFLETYAPGLGTSGPQLLVWGFFISTTVLFHGTCSINSLAHLIGRRRYKTKDESKNSFILALITLGEGWHNNHHHCPFAARQGFYWWEIDISYYGLLLLRRLGIIWEVKKPPARCYDPSSPTREASTA